MCVFDMIWCCDCNFSYHFLKSTQHNNQHNLYWFRPFQPPLFTATNNKIVVVMYSSSNSVIIKWFLIQPRKKNLLFSRFLLLLLCHWKHKVWRKKLSSFQCWWCLFFILLYVSSVRIHIWNVFFLCVCVEFLTKFVLWI